MNLYERLTYITKKNGDCKNWLGNLRWYMVEEETGRFSFQCISNLPQMTHQECVKTRMTMRLFEMNVKQVLLLT